MTRQEQTSKRSLVFSSWIREKLPDSSTGFCVGNQDWIYFDWRRNILMLAEEKTRRAEVATWFSRLIRTIIHPALKKHCAESGVDYRGYHLIQFENDGPQDGKIWFDRREVSEAELANILAFKDEIV